MTIQECQHRISILKGEIAITTTTPAMKVLCIGEIERLRNTIRELNGVAICVELDKEWRD